ncbi:MAG: nuclear transport factor 2 family protein [Candidatus Acidiferrales bacterium]
MMISRFRVLAVIAALGAASGLLAQQSPTHATSQADTRAIASMLEKQVADWNRGDIPAFMGGYWKSSDTEFVGEAGIQRGWDAVLRRYQANYPNRAAMGHLTFSGLEIHVLCADSAYVIGKYRLDREKDHPQGVFTLIFRKFPEGWRIVNDHTTAFRVAK